jgi:hypothetical protein
MGQIASKLPCKLPAGIVPGIPEQDRIAERLKELVVVFTKEFITAFKSVLIADIRAKNMASDEAKDERQLAHNEIIPPVRYEGVVKKAKDFKSIDFPITKYWVMIGDYTINEYAAKPESADAKPEKVINLYRWDVSRGDEKEKYTIEITHRRETREKMKIAFDDESDGWKWRGLLDSATYRAPTPLNPDPILARTFPIALRETRWKCWVWAGWYLDGTEGELLGDCFFSVLDQEIMREPFGKLPESARKMAYTGVKKMIDAAVTAGWKATLEATKPAKEIVEKVAAQALDPIFKAEADIKKEILQKVKDAVTPALQAIQGKLDEYVNKAMPTLLTASSEELALFTDSMRDSIKNGSDTDSVVKGLKHEMWENSWCWWGRNRKISNAIYDNIYVAHKSDGWFWYRLAWNLIEEYRNLNQFAFRACVSELEANKPADAASSVKQNIYPSVYAKLGHDIHWVTRDCLVKGIDYELRPDIMKVVNPLLNAILEPVEKLIPEVAKDVFDPRRTANEIIDETLSQTETQLVNAMLNKMNQQIQASVSAVPAL